MMFLRNKNCAMSPLLPLSLHLSPQHTLGGEYTWVLGRLLMLKRVLASIQKAQSWIFLSFFSHIALNKNVGATSYVMMDYFK